MGLVFTSENFDEEVLKAEGPVLVDFYADWCGPCKMMGPVIEEIAAEYEGKAKVGKINVDNSEDIAARYGVMSIPTLIIFKDGQIASKFVGVKSKEALSEALNQAK